MIDRLLKIILKWYWSWLIFALLMRIVFVFVILYYTISERLLEGGSFIKLLNKYRKEFMLPLFSGYDRATWLSAKKRKGV